MNHGEDSSSSDMQKQAQDSTASDLHKEDSPSGANNESLRESSK
jgi:hypothetical protein